MRIAIVSALLGLGWNVLAFFLAFVHGYGPLSEFFKPEWFGAGLAAGLTAGAFTVWTRREITKSPVRELFSTVATYYLAVCIWWVTLGIFSAVRTGFPPGVIGGGYYDLEGHLDYGRTVLVLATLYGPILVPLCWLSRDLVRWQIKRSLSQTR